MNKEQFIKINTTKKGVDISVQLEVDIGKDEEVDAFVTYCPALDLYGQGKTKEDAKKSIDEAIFVILSRSFEEGGLHEKLKNFGFNIERSLQAKEKRKVKSSSENWFSSYLSVASIPAYQ